MYMFQSYLDELSKESGIRFKLSFLEGKELFSSLKGVKKTSCISKEVALGREKGLLTLEKENENCASLLSFSINKKYIDLRYYREQMIMDILEGKGAAYEAISSTLPFLLRKATLFLISTDGNNYDVLATLKELYEESKAVAIVYDQNILLFGEFLSPYDHARGIVEAINTELFLKAYIAYETIPEGSFAVKSAFERAKEALAIGKNYSFRNTIFTSEDLVFEKAVQSIDPKVKKEITEDMDEKFSKLDPDMLITIEEFIASGLNISEAAKRLFVHRNTLIYRLEKLAKDTGYDVRNFKEALVFYVVFLLWKEYIK